MEDKISKRFGSHKILYSKYDPQIPAGAEREYIRLTNAYMKLLKDELEESLPKLKEIYKEELMTSDEYRQGMHFDSQTSLMMAINKLWTEMNQNLITKTEGYGLRKKLENMANLNRKLTIKEWKKACKSTIGIDIREDYYLGDFYKQGMEQWISDNVDLIKTLPNQSLDKMKEIVYKGYTGGLNTTDMIKAITKAYQMDKRHAKFIARDQTAKLNGAIQRAQQLDAGITHYKWCTCGDERVRNSHKALEGKVFEWGNPPENGDGRKCEPGEDYNCRCIGSPVFDKTTLNLPTEDNINGIEKAAEPISNEMSFDTPEALDNFFGVKPNYVRKSDPNRAEYEKAKELYSQSMFGAWYSNLQDEQSSAVTFYCSDGFSAINGLCRKEMTKNMVSMWETFEPYTIEQRIQELTSAISSFDLKENIVVHRTTEREFLDELQVGKIWKDNGFISTSMLAKKQASGDVVWDIHIPSGVGYGAYIKELSGSPEEYEFLLQRGTQLKINSIIGTEEGIKIDATVIGQDIPDKIEYATKEEVLAIWDKKGLKYDKFNLEGM